MQIEKVTQRTNISFLLFALLVASHTVLITEIFFFQSDFSFMIMLLFCLKEWVSQISYLFNQLSACLTFATNFDFQTQSHNNIHMCR